MKIRTRKDETFVNMKINKQKITFIFYIPKYACNKI